MKKLLFTLGMSLQAIYIFAQCSNAPGDPTFFPNNSWNCYVFGAGDADGGSGAWVSNYSGYFSMSELSFATNSGSGLSNAHSWDALDSPSSVSGYQGCPVPADNFSVIYMRRGVPQCGNYTIRIDKSSASILKINGQTVWQETYAVSDFEENLIAWAGYLDANSTIEFRLSFGVNSNNSGLMFESSFDQPVATVCDNSLTVNDKLLGYENVYSAPFYSAPVGMTFSGDASWNASEQLIRLTNGGGDLGTAVFTPSVTLAGFIVNFDMKIPTTSLANGTSFNFGNFNPTVGGGEGGFGSGLSVCFRTIAIPDAVEVKWNGVVLASTNYDVSYNELYETTIKVTSQGKVSVFYGPFQLALLSDVVIPGYESIDKSNWKMAFSGKTAALSNNIHRIDDLNLFSIERQEFSLDGVSWQSGSSFLNVPDNSYNPVVRSIDHPTCLISTNVVVPFDLTSLDGAVNANPCTYVSNSNVQEMGGYHMSNYHCNNTFQVVETFTHNGIVENTATWTLSGLGSGGVYQPSRTWSIGTTIVDVVVTDVYNNSKSTQYDVVINDPTPPLIIAPADTVFCYSQGLVLLGSPTYNLGCGAEVANDAPISGFSVGSTLVTWTITYDDGDTASDTQLVTVTSPNTYFEDSDGDGFGTSSGSNSIQSCTPVSGYVLSFSDCNDNNSSVYPGATETCGNNIDDDCANGDEACAPVAGCTDPQACNYNAQATINDGTCIAVSLIFIDLDGDGFGDAWGDSFETCSPSLYPNYVTNDLDCDAYNAAINPNATEVCNGFDDDCDGQTDEGVGNPIYADADNDGFGNPNNSMISCFLISGYVLNSTDCNDNMGSINPQAIEVCGNSVDEDCTGADLICPSAGGIGDAVTLNAINIYNSGTQSLINVNMINGSNTIENSGEGLELWFKFTATTNAARIALQGSTVVLDDNELSLYATPQTTGLPLIPLVVENDVTPSAMGISLDGGNETMFNDQLVVGQQYYVCVRNTNATPGSCKLNIARLLGSENDIMPYTNYTGIYNNTCQNFKAKFRNGAAGYVVNKYNDLSTFTQGNTPDWIYAMLATNGTGTATSVCQLGKITSPNLSNSNMTFYTSVDVTYILKDAFGNSNTLLAKGGSAMPVVLTPEADLNVRTADRCPVYKSLTSSVATNRSICGASMYNWEITETLPNPGLPVSINGAAFASRLMQMSAFPAITQGKTYDVRIRARHLDGMSYSEFGDNSCVRTIGAAGMQPTNNETPMTMASNSDFMIYPNPSAGENIYISITNPSSWVNLKVADASGRVVSTLSWNAEDMPVRNLNVPSDLANGMYMVTLSQFGKSSTLRMMIAN